MVDLIGCVDSRGAWIVNSLDDNKQLWLISALIYHRLEVRAYVLDNGIIQMEGPAEELRTSEHIKKHYLGI